MNDNSKQLTMIISAASHHLHAVTGNVATALLDTNGNGKILFSNSALSEVSGGTLLTLTQNYATFPCAESPCIYQHLLENGLVLYLLVIEQRHVFAIVGKPQDKIHIEEFNERLRRVLSEAM